MALDRILQIFGLRSAVSSLEPAAEGEAETHVKTLIEGLKRDVALELRKASTNQYLEAVITQPSLAPCMSIIGSALGDPIKPFDQRPAFDKRIRRMVESRGGIKKNQCLFLRQYEDSRVAFAAFWPWSNSDKITLKIGTYD